MLYERMRIASVTEEYFSDNVLTFQGRQIYPATFENSAFLIILNGAATTEKASIYVTVFGTSTTTPAIICIAKNGSGIYPMIAHTGTNRLYVKWSDKGTGSIYANILKMY